MRSVAVLVLIASLTRRWMQAIAGRTHGQAAPSDADVQRSRRSDTLAGAVFQAQLRAGNVDLAEGCVSLLRFALLYRNSMTCVTPLITSLCEFRTHADFMCGLVLGFFLGILMIFLLWELRMSRQQRMGVITGILMNGLFAVFRHHVRTEHAAELVPAHHSHG